MAFILLGLVVTLIVSVSIWIFMEVDSSDQPLYRVLYLLPHLVWLFPIYRAYKNDKTISSIEFYEDYLTIKRLVEKDYSVHWMAVKKIKYKDGRSCFSKGLVIELKSGKSFEMICEREVFDAVIKELKKFRVLEAERRKAKAQ